MYPGGASTRRRRFSLTQSQSQATIDAVGQVLRALDGAEHARLTNGRPFVTLSWAQSIDGSIALEPGRKFALSGGESLALTHALRATHDAILIGIDTLLADDPELGVRHWAGPWPAPVILDSRLRTPPTARLLASGGPRPIRIVCTASADEGRGHPLRARGATILRVAAWDNGWVDLEALMAALAASGIKRLMVEGGAKVLTSFLRARLGDYAVVTVAPQLLGGLAAVGSLPHRRLPRLRTPLSFQLADDFVLSGALHWGAG
ncbi:MAG TPA: RibD family protein [Polyangia bacterium]|nr:RibD family protein [Polyangia bacterium]